MAKGLDIGQTYLNNKAVLRFIKAIAVVQSEKTVDMINSAPFFSIMMDGSIDITGDEQESVYVRLSHRWKPIERFLGIGSPVDTSAQQLQVFLLDMMTTLGIDTDIFRVLKLNSLIVNKIICFENALERSHRRQLIKVLLITCYQCNSKLPRF